MNKSIYWSVELIAVKPNWRGLIEVLTGDIILLKAKHSSILEISDNSEIGQ